MQLRKVLQQSNDRVPPLAHLWAPWMLLFDEIWLKEKSRRLPQLKYMLYYDILRTSLNTLKTVCRFDHSKLYSQIEIDRTIELEKTEEIFMVSYFEECQWLNVRSEDLRLKLTFLEDCTLAENLKFCRQHSILYLYYSNCCNAKVNIFKGLPELTEKANIFLRTDEIWYPLCTREKLWPS